MRSLTVILTLTIVAAAAAPVRAQDADKGIAMPVTITGGLIVSDRPKADEADASSVAPGFRVVLYPSLKISRGWSVRSAVQIQSSPFFYYESFYAEKEIETRVQQLFLSYNRPGESSSIGFKVGKLASAFGAFPLRYSDTVNPLIDQPLAYAYSVKLRPDQLPCGGADLLHQQTYPVYVHHYCGGATAEREGMVPVTLYGLPGAEIDATWRKFDGRAQLTNSSPANPQSLRSESQHAQWTAGGGYTIRQGFRVGASGFRGPFLEKDVRSLLDSATGPRDYPATGMGVDVQWASGRWSSNAEWQRVEFHYPRFRVPPAISSGFVDVKAILNPRFYTALRVGFENHSRVVDGSGIAKPRFYPNRQSYELALGYHLNRSQTIKLGYEWLKTDGIAGTRDSVIGAQFVTSLHSLSKGF